MVAGTKLKCGDDGEDAFVLVDVDPVAEDEGAGQRLAGLAHGGNPA